MCGCEGYLLAGHGLPGYNSDAACLVALPPSSHGPLGGVLACDDGVLVWREDALQVGLRGASGVNPTGEVSWRQSVLEKVRLGECDDVWFGLMEEALEPGCAGVACSSRVVLQHLVSMWPQGARRIILYCWSLWQARTVLAEWAHRTNGLYAVYGGVPEVYPTVSRVKGLSNAAQFVLLERLLSEGWLSGSLAAQRRRGILSVLQGRRVS